MKSLLAPFVGFLGLDLRHNERADGEPQEWVMERVSRKPATLVTQVLTIELNYDLFSQRRRFRFLRE